MWGNERMSVWLEPTEEELGRGGQERCGKPQHWASSEDKESCVGGKVATRVRCFLFVLWCWV